MLCCGVKPNICGWPTWPALDAVVASSGLDVLRSRAAGAYVFQAVLAGLDLAVALGESVRYSSVHELAVDLS
jgi:hypothetical protein